MDNTTKKVIRDLARRRPRDLIITELAEMGRLEWDDAAALVNEIEEKYKEEINKKQRPAFFLLGAGLTFGGLLLFISMLLASANGLSIYFLRFPIPYLGNGIFAFMGLLAFLGGLRGVLRLLRRA